VSEGFGGRAEIDEPAAADYGRFDNGLRAL
jgi:hypothetical protein